MSEAKLDQRQKNREAVARYRATAKGKRINKAYDDAWHLRWRTENPDLSKEVKQLWYEENKASRTAKQREYAKNNPVVVLAKNRRRKHRERAAQGHYTEAQWQDRLAFYGFQCYLCGVDWFSLDSFDRTIDHVIPLSQGGTNWSSNLRPACRKCNAEKGS